MFKALRGVRVALKTNTVERHLEMVRVAMEEAARPRESNNTGSLIILQHDREIDRPEAKLSK